MGESLIGLVDSALATGWITHALLTLRVVALFTMTPILHVIPVPGYVRAYLLLALSAAIAAGMAAPPLLEPMSWGMLMQAAIGELTLGATLG
ncbi:hypothetical protein [Pseudorhodoferax sp.]|uniref:hypothetical protein n=1 Tax=Pseudorhodoferax sp. TaxID=1993553 RepID=UPI002DD64E37|nr:hypothetical protein [Pseudorhodoferax sp.]